MNTTIKASAKLVNSIQTSLGQRPFKVEGTFRGKAKVTKNGKTIGFFTPLELDRLVIELVQQGYELPGCKAWQLELELNTLMK